MGIGIIADGGNAFIPNDYTLTVGAVLFAPANNANIFFNCWEGVFSSYYSNNYIQKNTFSSDNINSPFYLRALQIFPSTGGTTRFEYNNVHNLSQGTRCYIGTPTFTFNNFSFSANTINVGPLANQTGGVAMNFGSISKQTSNIPVIISANTITGAGIGIWLNPFDLKTEILGNIINVLGSPNSDENGRGGIVVNSSTFIKIAENGITGNYYSNATDKYGCGIHLFNSNDCRVYCDSVVNVRQGYIFEGSCQPVSSASMVFVHNTMKNCRDGLVLLNGGTISQIGNPNSPADNWWKLSGFFDNSHTLADQSNFQYLGNQFSRFYCRNLPGYFPTLNLHTTLTPITWALVPEKATGPLTVVCNTILPISFSNDPVEELKKMLINRNEYPVLEQEAEWQNKKYAYELLTFDSIFANVNDSTLVNFNDSIQNENIATIVWTDEMIRQYDYYFAHYLINGLTPENLMEQNYRIFIRYYLLWCENPEREFTQVEINALYTVANQCANMGGKAVLQAQLFLDYILHQDGVWNSNCPIPASSLRKANKPAIETTNTKMPDNFYFSLTCNPCDEEINFKILKNELVSSLILTDLSGKKIVALKPINGLNKMDAMSLLNGVYCLNLNLSNGNKISKKIVLIHK